jgi:hypothetical protein
MDASATFVGADERGEDAASTYQKSIAQCLRAML